MAYNIRDILGSANPRGDYSDDGVIQRLRGWEEDVRDAYRRAGVNNDPAIRFGGKLPLDVLPFDEQVRLMGRYREAIGLDTVLSYLSTKGSNNIHASLVDQITTPGIGRRVSNIWEHLTGEKSLGSDNPYGRFVADVDDSVIGQIYGGMNLQGYYRPRATKAGVPDGAFGAQHYFGLSSDLPSTESLMRSRQNATDLAGKRMMVFDIETAGFRPGNIREVAYQTMEYGNRSSAVQGQVLFRPGQGTRGQMVSGGNALPLHKFMDRQFGLDTADIPIGDSGDDFLGRVMPWIREARSVDRIVGHNIEDFDIGQVFQGISGTRKYREDSDFRRYIDESYNDIRGKTIDTLRLARSAPNLAGLPTAAVEGRGGAYSIGNLLLETDLAKRIGIQQVADAMGYDPGSGVFTKGLHFGDVDTLVTSGLLQHLPDLQQTSLMNSGLTDEETRIAALIQKQIQSSAAITPFTDIRDPSNIHSSIKAMLGTDRPSINPIQQEILLERRLDMGLPAGTVNPLGPESRTLLSTIGGFDRLIGRDQHTPYGAMYDRGARPTRAKFAEFQEVLKKRGIGFSGLSFEERMFGTGLSSLTAGVSADDASFAALARDSLVSRFKTFDPGAMQYVTRSGKVTLPPQVLNHLGMLTNADNPAMMSLSIVNPSAASASPSVNLAYQFADESDLDKAVIGLLNIHDEGYEGFARMMGMDVKDTATRTAYGNFERAMTRTDDNNLINTLLRTGTTRGVSVGQLTPEDGAGGVIDFLRAVNNTDKLRDESMLGFRLPFMNMSLDSTGSGVIRTAGAIMDLGLTPEGRKAIGQQVAMASSAYRPGGSSGARRGFSGVSSNPLMATYARQMSDASTGEMQGALRAYEVFDQKIVPNIGKGLAGIAALGIGAYLLHRKRESDRYDVAFDYAGPEPGPSRYALADVIEQRQLQGQNGYYRQVDPMATATLTDSLYYSSIGHTSTSWDRNSAIYGGVL